MPAILFLAAAVLGFVAASGFLFGQLFAGHFSTGATLAGVAGLASAVAAVRMGLDAAWRAPWARWAGLAALVGVAIDAAAYYRSAAIAGNYYGWGLIGPFCAAAALVALTAHRRCHGR